MFDSLVGTDLGSLLLNPSLILLLNPSLISRLVFQVISDVTRYGLFVANFTDSKKSYTSQVWISNKTVYL